MDLIIKIKVKICNFNFIICKINFIKVKVNYTLNKWIKQINKLIKTLNFKVNLKIKMQKRNKLMMKIII
jgi:hypothetical protein